MVPLLIAPTTSSPEVNLDPEKGLLRISGESYPSNSYEFFRPILDWIDLYLSQHASATLEVDLTYLNTSSIKCMLDILELLEKNHKEGKKVGVRWCCDKENHRALELVEEFREDLTLPFEIISTEP